MFKPLKKLIKEKLYNRFGLTHRLYEIPVSLFKYLERGKPICLVDIGAYDGSFTQVMARYCGISKGLLIEPLPHRAANLNQIFNSPEYTVLECALSAKGGTTEFEINEFEATSSILRIKRTIPELSTLKLGAGKIIECRTKTLDEIILENQISTIDLIKIDVQGAEHLVIEGATETLKIAQMVWTEVSFKALYEGSSTFQDIYSLLNQAGFRLVELESGFRSPKGELLQSDALFVRL